MGQLMSLRKCSGAAGGLPDGDLDLTLAAEPGLTDPQEIVLHDALASFLAQSRACVQAVRDYRDQAAVLRAAMGAPQDEAQQLRAFMSVLPCVSLVKDAFDLSARLGQELPALFRFLAGRNLREHQLLLRRLADVLEVVMSFDFEKMRQPALQNEFSYYRRYYGKLAGRVTPAAALRVQEAEAGLISMFIAQNLPLTIAVENAIKGLGGKGKGGGSSSEDGAALVCGAVNTVGVLANVACDLALRPGLPDETRRYALRVMTSAVVLYDRVSAAGVFIRRSPVRTKKCLRTLRRAQGAADGTSSSLAQQLLDSVRYSTVHYKDGSTPGYIRTLLSD